MFDPRTKYLARVRNPHPLVSAEASLIQLKSQTAGQIAHHGKNYGDTTVDQLVDNTVEDPSKRAPLVMGGLDNTGITDVVAGVAEREKPPRAWYIAFGIANLLLVMLGANILHDFYWCRRLG